MLLQLLQTYEVPDTDLRVVDETILTIRSSLSANNKVYPIVELGDKSFPIMCEYRELSMQEEKFYHQELICTTTHVMSPVERDMMLLFDNDIRETIKIKSGDKLFVDGFTMCSIDKKYVAYHEREGIRYELYLNMFMLNLKFVEYFMKNKRFMSL